MTDKENRREGFLRQVLIFHGTGVLFLLLLALLYFDANVLMLVFAGILVAVLLHEAGASLRRWLPLSRGWALAAVVGAALGVLALGGWLLAPGVADQADQLADALPRSLQQLQSALQRHGVLHRLADSLPSPDSLLSQASSMVARAGVFFSGIVGALANAAIVAIVGIYFAAAPGAYIEGLVTLVPVAKRPRAREILHQAGHTLAGWLLGKLVSMAIVGVATGVGLALLGVPLAMVLGIVAGLLDFIPYLGPVMAGVPAVLIAFSEGPMPALYVVLLFFALQVAEGYLLVPLIQRRTVSLPPALIIIMQVLFGAFLGLGGVALATPLTAMLAVLVSMLYVQDVLGDPVGVPGEHGDR